MQGAKTSTTEAMQRDIETLMPELHLPLGIVSFRSPCAARDTLARALRCAPAHQSRGKMIESSQWTAQE